ncbi:MAG: hypothetical protein IJV27_01080 [Prevotella sp.]|nr:hypothetical protein [Prevotella sp.]
MKKEYLIPRMKEIVLSDDVMEIIGMSDDDTTESKDADFDYEPEKSIWDE